MKINVFNVDGNKDEADNSLAIILKQAVADLEADGDVVEDVKMEELNATYTFKVAGKEDYMVLSVAHDNLTEMFEVDFDLADGELADNEQLSLFADSDREIIGGALDAVFPTVDPVLDDDDLEYMEEENHGDMKIVRYMRLDTDQEAVRVYQYDDKKRKEGSTNGRLIQEYSLNK